MTAVGFAERDREGVTVVGALLVGAAGLLSFVWLATTRGSDVSTSDFVIGLVVGTVGIGVLPTAAYYVLGRGVGHRPGWLVVIWLVTQVPFAFVLFLAAIYSLDMTHCGPDAYECPI